MSQIMKSARKKFDLQNEPLHSYNLRSLSIADKILLKKKFVGELALVRSAIEKVGGIVRTIERCCKKSSNNIPANRKSKSSEINKGLKNADAISEVAHLRFDVSVGKPEGSFCLKKISKDPKPSKTVQRDSKNSVGIQKKRHCSYSNVLTSVVDAHKKIPQAKALLKSSCDGGTKGFVDPLYKLEQISSLKAISIAKLKSRFTKVNVKAQQQHRNLDEKRRAFRMQREKDKLEKLCKEEKSRIEAKLKAAKSAARKTKFEQKMKIKKEREASRLAMEKMEATVEFGDFNEVVKELKVLGCQNISFYVLRELGLFLKDDDFDDYKITKIPIYANDKIEGEDIRILSSGM